MDTGTSMWCEGNHTRLFPTPLTVVEVEGTGFIDALARKLCNQEGGAVHVQKWPHISKALCVRVHVHHAFFVGRQNNNKLAWWWGKNKKGKGTCPCHPWYPRGKGHLVCFQKPRSKIPLLFDIVPLSLCFQAGDVFMNLLFCAVVGGTDGTLDEWWKEIRWTCKKRTWHGFRSAIFGWRVWRNHQCS